VAPATGRIDTTGPPARRLLYQLTMPAPISSLTRTAALLAATLTVAAPQVAHAGAGAQGVRLQGVRLQGVRLQGVRLQGVRLQGVRLQGTSMSSLNLSGSSVQGYRWNSSGGYWEYRYPTYHYRLIGSSWQGPYSGGMAGAWMTADLDDGTTLDVYVSTAKQDSARNTMPGRSSNSDVYLFKLMYRTGTLKSDWHYLCEGDHYGMFLKGSWNEHGFWSSSGTTFACTNGVLAKCARDFGYKPWRNMVDKYGDLRSMRNFHQTCTRAARADYCENGLSFTQDGTMVDMFDNAGFNVPVSEYDYSFDGFAIEGLFEEQVEAPLSAHSQLRRTRYEGTASLSNGEDVCAPDTLDLADPNSLFYQKSWTYPGVAPVIAISTSTYCPHDVNVSGDKMVWDCNACTETVCKADSYCCDVKWDGICVNEADSMCN
jgi:hypothetical protein